MSQTTVAAKWNRPTFDERWRHGGWYTSNQYPSGASGCVHNNRADQPGKWFVVGHEDDLGPFATRLEAALAEKCLILELQASQKLLWLVQRAAAIRNPYPTKWTKEETRRSWEHWDKEAAAALAAAEGGAE